VALRRYLQEEVALDFVEGQLTRREALRRLGLLGLSVTAAGALITACGGGSEESASTPTNPKEPKARLGPATSSAAASDLPPTPPGTTESIRFPGPNGELQGAWSSASNPKGAVLVIHENRGLTDHIRTIPPRLAADGYSALAVDLLSEEGGTAALGGDAQAIGALGAAPATRMVADLRAGIDELQKRVPTRKVGVIGFCFGGGMTWQLLAAGEPRLAAAVPFYGPFPSGAGLAGSPNAAVLGVYAGLDNRVNGTKDAAEAALTAAGLTHELRVFDGVDHAFFNDTGPRYDADAAAQAYQAMLDWFGQHLAA
jgi:carboxymethylenebutenolidase